MAIHYAIMHPKTPKILDIHNSNMGIYNWRIDIHNYAFIQLGMDVHN